LYVNIPRGEADGRFFRLHHDTLGEEARSGLRWGPGEWRGRRRTNRVCFEKLPGLRDGGVSSFEGCLAMRREKEERRGRRKKRKEKRSHRATLRSTISGARNARRCPRVMFRGTRKEAYPPKMHIPGRGAAPRALNI